MSEKSKRNTGALVKQRIADLVPAIETIVVFIIICCINNSFGTAKSIRSVLVSAAPMIVMASAYTFVILTGSIDLSNGTLLTLTCVLTTFIYHQYGNWCVLIMIAIGAAAGLINSSLIVLFKMPAFIVTLCTQQLWKCAALVISGGASHGIPKAAWTMLEWTTNTLLGIPYMFWAAILFWLCLVFIQKYTVIGRKIFAIGANEKAARMMGVQIRSTRFAAYIISDIGAGIAGFLYALRLKSSSATLGDPLNLMALSTVVLGGTWLSGGHGSVAKTMPAALTVMMLQSALKVVGLDAYYQDITFGLILIIAIMINSDHNRSNTTNIV